MCYKVEISFYVCQLLYYSSICVKETNSYLRERTQPYLIILEISNVELISASFIRVIIIPSYILSFKGFFSNCSVSPSYIMPKIYNILKTSLAVVKINFNSTKCLNL